MAKKKNIVDEKKKPILGRLLILQIGLIASWYLGQKNMVSPIVVGVLILTFTAAIFYTIYQRIPTARNGICGKSGARVFDTIAYASDREDR